MFQTRCKLVAGIRWCLRSIQSNSSWTLDHNHRISIRQLVTSEYTNDRRLIACNLHHKNKRIHCPERDICVGNLHNKILNWNNHPRLLHKVHHRQCQLRWSRANNLVQVRCNIHSTLEKLKHPSWIGHTFHQPMQSVDQLYKRCSKPKGKKADLSAIINSWNFVAASQITLNISDCFLSSQFDWYFAHFFPAWQLENWRLFSQQNLMFDRHSSWRFVGISCNMPKW